MTSSALRMLDTDTACYIIKARHRSVDARFAEASPEDICISAVTRSELLFGLKPLPQNHRLHVSVERFLLQVSTRSWDAQAADMHADLRHRLMVSGRLIGDMDMMIAAHAISLGYVLVTNNLRHFGRLQPDLQLENWVNTTT